MILFLISLASNLIISYGIYELSKKLGYKKGYLAWIPFLQYFVLIKSLNKNIEKYFYLPLFYIILSIFYFILSFTIKEGSNFFLELIASFGGILIYLSYGYFLFKYIKILIKLSKKVNLGKYITLGLFFLPVIFFPYISYKYKLK